MLIENCVRGLKVKTTGNPISSPSRMDSKCCKWEDINGYLTVYRLDPDDMASLHKGIQVRPHVEFECEQVEPYSLITLSKGK